MAVANWLARALARAMLYTATAGGTWVIGDLAWAEINGKRVTFTATTTTATHMVTGLLAALQASSITEFAAITWVSPTSTTITGTTAAGVPATITVDKTTAGTGTFTGAVTMAATGPNDWNDLNNWDTAAVPGNGDTANVNLDLGSVLYGLGQSAVTLANLRVFSVGQTTNTFGLPKINAAGYTEYQLRALEIGATLWTIDCGSPLVAINFGSVQMSGEVRRSGQSNTPGLPAILLQGTNAANAIDVASGRVGLAYYDGESFVAATATFAASAEVIAGSGAVLTDVVSNGQIISQGTGTNWQTAGGTADIRGTPGFSILDAEAGQTIVRFGGAIAEVIVGGAGGILNCSLDNTDRTFANCTLDRGGQIIDPNETITYTNGIMIEPGVTGIQAAA